MGVLIFVKLIMLSTLTKVYILSNLKKNCAVLILTHWIYPSFHFKWIICESTHFIFHWAGIRLFPNDESSVWHILFCSRSLLQMCCLILDHFWAPNPGQSGQERVTQWSINYWFGFNHCMPPQWLYVRSRRRWLNAYTCSVAESPRLSERHDALIWYCFTDDRCFSSHAL